MTKQEAFVDSVDQDQTAQNMKSNLWSTLSTFFILDYNWTFFFVILQWMWFPNALNFFNSKILSFGKEVKWNNDNWSFDQCVNVLKL